MKGYIGRPEAAKKTRGEQFLFVNKRFVKHGYLHHAVMMAFEGLLGSGQYPFYTLFLEMSPDLVDINVHPTKTEVKFAEERMLYGLVQAAVRQALGVSQVSTHLDFELNTNFVKDLREGRINTGIPSTGTYQKPEKSERQKSNAKNWERLYQTEDQNGYEGTSFAEHFLNAIPEGEEPQTTITFSSAANDTSPEEVVPDYALNEGRRWVFQIEDRFIASPVRTGILLIHQQAAHERILYERFLGSADRDRGASQQLLFPSLIRLNDADFTLFNEIQDDLGRMGFIFEEAEDNNVKLLGIPTDLPTVSEVTLLEELLEQYKQQTTLEGSERRQALAGVLARRAAIKAGQTLDPEEMKKIIDLLFACQNPNYSPDGERTQTFLDGQGISQLF
ncbi:MAG: hypothetical protein AAF740_04180 [Bacteroidota bacterium]